MTTFQDLMHDLGGEYTKLRFGCVDVREDLTLILKEGGINAPESKLMDTITYAKTVLMRIKQYMSCAAGLINMVSPLIDKSAGSNNEIYSMRGPNERITVLAGKSLEVLEKNNLKLLSESQLKEVISTAEKNIKCIMDFSKEAEDIFLAVKPKLYELIGKETEVEFGNGCRLLLLDDEVDICSYLKNFLVKKNFIVETALSSEKAMDSTRKFKPQIALLDYKLDTEETGMDVLKFIKANLPDCKCFMFTFVDDKEILQKCKDLGAMGTLVKPVVVEVMKKELYKAVKELLNGT